MEIKTKRLRIIALTTEQMEILCENPEKLYNSLGFVTFGVSPDEHLQSAYREMYNQCLNHEKEYLFYTNRIIVLTSENRVIGSIGFLGEPNENHEVEIGYGINDSYRNQGYATEALKAMGEWAFSNGVYYLQAQTEPDNEPSKRVLEKCEFSSVGEKDGNLLYELEKPASAWLSICMCLGMSLGLCFGASFENTSIGMCIGIAIGVAIGVALDSDDKKKRTR